MEHEARESVYLRHEVRPFILFTDQWYPPAVDAAPLLAHMLSDLIVHIRCFVG